MVEFNEVLNLVAIESIGEVERISMLKGLTYFLHRTVSYEGCKHLAYRKPICRLQYLFRSMCRYVYSDVLFPILQELLLHSLSFTFIRFKIR